MKPILDLIGKRFGRLVVIGIDLEKTKETGHVTFICKCDCGNIKSIRGSALRTGDAKSCGCLAKEHNSIRNEIIIYDELGYGICFLNNSNEYFIFDIEDVDIVRGKCWCKGGNGYIMTNKNKFNKQAQYLHRAIMSKYENIDDKIIDHIDHNPFNNRRKSNLRTCTRDQNNRNKFTPGSNIGEQNISYDPTKNQYRVYIMNNGKRHEKKFNNKDDAIQYRNEYFKNHPEIDEFRYKQESDYKYNTEINSVTDPFKYTNPNNLEIISPFTIVDESKFNK